MAPPVAGAGSTGPSDSRAGRPPDPRRITVYVRVDSVNRRADAELIEDLRLFARGEGEQPLPGLDSEASAIDTGHPGNRS